MWTFINGQFLDMCRSFYSDLTTSSHIFWFPLSNDATYLNILPNPFNSTKSYLFLEELSALHNHITTNAAEIIGIGRNRNPPVCVHCSAGVGRTGVAILTDILLYCVDHNVDIDIPKMLTHLRQQRMLMVQTVAQYKFVHTALIAYLKQSRLI